MSRVTAVPRRDFLRLGALGGAALLLPTRAGTTGTPLAIARTAVDFTRPLNIPGVLSPVRSDADGDHYELTMREGETEMLPGIATRIWGYDGTYPGPTIVAQRDRTVTVLQRNSLSEPLAIHLHGANVAPEHDGHPHDAIAPGAERLYVYPNRQAASTLWYHDHAMGTTGPHVYRGLAGLYLLHDPAEDALGLPSGNRDVPLLIADRSFDGDGQLVYDPADHMGVLGSHVLVNGIHEPVLAVAPTRYRFRALNGSNATFYELQINDLSDPTEPTIRPLQIASDGGLLASPAGFRSITIFPAERIEFVVDFSAHAPGTSLVLRDGLRGTDLLRFDVVGGAPAPAPLPTQLRTITALAAPRVVRDITLDRDSATGVWQLNGHGFDHAQFDALPRLGSVEHWRLTNTTAMTHPIHLHLVMFRVLSRNGNAPGAREAGWKDTVPVAPGETVEIAARFGDHAGPFVYHCHILEHEDHDMMSQFRVIDLQRLAGSGRTETAAAVSAATFGPGVPVVFVATANGFADALAGGPEAARLGGPMLLTDGTQLSEATRVEVTRLQPQRVVILGGTRAVSDNVKQQLEQASGAPVTRLFGGDRYATAAAVSVAHHPNGAATVYVATGEDFPDALAGGVAAARAGGPLLLVQRDAVPDATGQELQRLSPTRIFVLGGPRAVNDQVLAELGTYASGGASRIAGPSRFATAAAIAKHAFPSGAEVAIIATGRAFPDALSGVPAAFRENAPVLLIEPTAIPEETATELTRLGPRRIVLLGGPGAISASVEDGLVAYLRDP